MRCRCPRCVIWAVSVAAVLSTPVYSAYKGHADDRDVAAVLSTYPALKGTPADSCATCHRSGEVADPLVPGTMRSENHCDYCHVRSVRGTHPVRETLNRYGVAYLAAGRSAAAIRALASGDSDGDGATNEAEFTRGTNPGDPASHPGVPVAPSRTYTLAALAALTPAITQTVFVNTTKSRSGDAYNDYRGHAVWPVLQAIGVQPSATSIDVLAADGYEYTFTVAELRRTWPQGAPVLGLGTRELGACGWVSYNASSLDAARPLPPARIMFAVEQNGKALPRASLDAASGRLVGTGPLRVIVPQFQVSPPDLSQTADPACATKVASAHTYHDAYDHNGGKSSYGIVAVRVKPLPTGTRDIDWQTPALERLARDEIVFFGALTPRPPAR